MADIPFFEKDDPVVKALFSGKKAERNRDKQFNEGPIEVLPGHMSNDHDFLRFKDRLSIKLTDRLPQNVDEKGRLFGNGVSANFYGARHVNGFPMIPAMWPVVDNSYRREEANLSNSWQKPWHEMVLRSLTRLFFSDLEPVPMKVRKGSSSVMPNFSTNMAVKLDMARWTHQSAQRAGEQMLKGDFERAWLDYNIGGASYVVYRRQSSDKVSFENGQWSAKERPVATFDYAISGGKRGSMITASKSLEGVDFWTPKGFFRERNRSAYGVPWSVNSALAPIAQSVRKKIYHDFEYTYHHTTRKSMQDDLRQTKYIIAADVSNHDQLWPMFFLDTICDELLRMGYAEWWVKILKTSMELPYYVTDVSPTEGNRLLGDWRNPNLRAGMASGNAFTDIFGAMGMTCNYFIVQTEHTAPELIRQMQDQSQTDQMIYSYLTGALPIAQKNKSDDALLMWLDRSKFTQAERLQDKMADEVDVCPYMTVSYEHGGAFLGNQLLYPENKDASEITLIGDVGSLVRNMFSPEYSVMSQIQDRSKTKRPFPGLAWGTIPEAYGSAPAYSEVMETIEECWSDVYGESYRGYRDRLFREDEMALAKYIAQQDLSGGMENFTQIDREVLANPEKLQYKYDEADVNPMLVDMLFNGLPLHEVEDYFYSITRNA